MFRQRPILSCILLALSFHLSGCAVLWFHDVDEKSPPPVEPPENFSDAGQSQLPSRWWQTFDEPELDRLVSDVLDNNLDLRVAWARLDQSAAIMKGAKGAYFPQITAGATWRRNQQAFPFGQGNETSLKVLRTTYPLSVSASYEVDLWGRVRATANAAELDFEATRQDFESAAMTLAASVVETWLGIRAEQAQVELIHSQVEANETVLELVELRFQQGLASALDVYQQKQLLIGSRAQLPNAQARLQVFQNQLAVLMGKPPGTVEFSRLTGDIPELPPLPATGVPAELVQRRPDLRSAQLRVASADYRVAAAIASRFPSVQLSASTGFNAFWPDSPFTNFVWNLAAGLTAPLFTGGRLEAEQQRTEAVVKEAVASYGQTLLNALREVEDALVQESRQRQYLEEIEAQTETAEAALREARERYVSGLSDYLPVLTALSTLQNAQRTLITARRQLVSFRVQLCRALGGDWTRELEPPAESEESSS